MTCKFSLDIQFLVAINDISLPNSMRTQWWFFTVRLWGIWGNFLNSGPICSLESRKKIKGEVSRYSYNLILGSSFNLSSVQDFIFLSKSDVLPIPKHTFKYSFFFFVSSFFLKPFCGISKEQWNWIKARTIG